MKRQLASHKILKHQAELSEEDLQELTQALSYRDVEADTEIYRYGDEPRYFFMVVKGQVSRQVRNPGIPDWDWAMSIYQGLLEWKEREFDYKVQQKMLLEQKNLMLNMDFKQFANIMSYASKQQ